jgi:hypothetical protein
MSERTTPHQLPGYPDGQAPVRTLAGYGRVLLPAPVATSEPTAGGTEACWLCGIRLGTSQLVADGSSACADVRWYCQDAAACTARWTSASAARTGTHEDRAQGSQLPIDHQHASGDQAQQRGGPAHGMVPAAPAAEGTSTPWW